MVKLYVRVYKSPKRSNYVANIVKNPRKHSRAIKTVLVEFDAKTIKTTFGKKK